MTTTVNPDIVPRLSETAYRRIRDKLVMLAIRPGEPINEERLGAELGMGRTPIREALKRLESERLVVSFSRRGTFAADINVTDLAHIFEVRQRLEPLAAERATVRATPTDRADLQRLLDQLDPHRTASQPLAELMATDLRVHRALYAATHNPYLQDTLTTYDNLATRIWCLFVERLSGVAGHIDEHAPLLRAIIAGDQQLAGRMAADHVVGFEAEIRAVL